MTIGGVGADLFAPFPLKYIIDTLTGHTVDLPQFPGSTELLNFFQKFETNKTHGIIGFSVTLLLFTGFMSAILSFFQLYLATFIAKTLTNKLSKRLFDHLQRLSVNWHHTHEQGDLVQRISGKAKSDSWPCASTDATEIKKLSPCWKPSSPGESARNITSTGTEIRLR